MAQVALAAVSLTAAGLVVRSLVKLQQVELLYEPKKLLVATLAGQPQLDNPIRQRAALEVVLANTSALPGVRAVSPVMAVPFVGAGGGISQGQGEVRAQHGDHGVVRQGVAEGKGGQQAVGVSGGGGR